MRNCCQCRGFSLIEVVIAVGIFAVAVIGLVGFLPMLARESTEASDASVAAHLPAALESELGRLIALQGFGAFADAVPLMEASAMNGMSFVASRDGAALASVASPAVAVPDDDQYFRLDVSRFNAPPLVFEHAGAVLALYVRVSWPYRVPGSGPTEVQNRTETGWTLALTR
jgi:prepilin-type N-terminal cleavage/methylation domain-containing protein